MSTRRASKRYLPYITEQKTSSTQQSCSTEMYTANSCHVLVMSYELWEQRPGVLYRGQKSNMIQLILYRQKATVARSPSWPLKAVILWCKRQNYSSNNWMQNCLHPALRTPALVIGCQPCSRALFRAWCWAWWVMSGLAGPNAGLNASINKPPSCCFLSAKEG